MAIITASNFDYKGALPNFERDYYATLSDMINVNENYLPNVFIGVCAETGKAYLYNKSNEIDPVLGKWREFVGNSADVIRKTNDLISFEPMYNGEIVQYIGEDESGEDGYVHGYFYKAVLLEESGEESGEYYIWDQVDVQDISDRIRKVKDLDLYTPEENEIVEYVGPTTTSYINGYFYQASASSFNVDNHEDPDITLTIIDQDKFDSWLIDLKTTYGDFDYIKITANGGPMRLVYCSADLETPVLIPGQEEPGPYYGGGLGVVGLQFVGNYYASTSGTSLYIRLGGTFEWKQKDVQPASPVVDTLESTSTTDALSANQGHVLKGMIDSIGRYIDNWNAETGLPYTLQSPYTYKQGDRFLVTNAIVPQPSMATISQTQGSGITDLSVNVSTIETFLDLKEDENILFWYTDYLAVKTSSATGSDAMIKIVDTDKFDTWFQQQSQIPSEIPDYPDFYGLQFYTYSAGRTDPETGGNINCNWLYLYRLYYNQDHSRLHNDTIDQPYAPASEGLAGINAILAENYGFILRGDNVVFESVIGGRPHDNFTMTKSGVDAWTYCLTDVSSFSDYGISFEGTSNPDDTITVVYTAPTYNYRPNGSSYNGEASTIIETGEVAAGDEYVYTGSAWLLQANTQKEISFGALKGSPYDNTNLSDALNTKVTTTDIANRVYGTDNDGHPTTFDKSSFGLVNDVRIHGNTKVVDKIANLSVVEQELIMPIPSEDYVGRIIQYIGEEESGEEDYVHGYFYEAKVSGDPSSIECTGTDSSTLYPYHITLDKDTFETQITTEGEYMFHYDGTNWTLNNNVISLDDYGISIQEGITYSSGDNIYIQYTESTIVYSWVAIPVQPDAEPITNAEIDEMWS